MFGENATGPRFKETNLRGRTPICNFLWFPEVVSYVPTDVFCVMEVACLDANSGFHPKSLAEVLKATNIRKNLMILGPELAAPILWAPGVLTAGKPPCP